jgi:hypothetical protein
MRLRAGLWPRGGLWRHADFLKLWSAETVSQVGSQISALALPFVAIVTLDVSAFEVALLMRPLPAGGFHRTTLAFPFVALLVALAIRTIVERIAGWTARPRLEPAMAGTLLVLFTLINVLALERMTSADEEISGLTDSVPITAYVEERVPGGAPVIVSSFPNYHLERELIVRTGDSYDVRIEPFDEAVEHGDSTVIVLFQPPSDQIHRLEARYSGGEWVESYYGRELQRHLIWVPEALARE